MAVFRIIALPGSGLRFGVNRVISVISRIGLQSSALFAGILSFLAVYVVGAILIIFVLSVFSDAFGHDRLLMVLRVCGYVSLAFPAYVAARVAGKNGWRHGTAIGVLEGLAVVVLMTYTFSWEGTYQHEVVIRMVPAFLVVFAICVAGGGLGEWQNRRHKHV